MSLKVLAALLLCSQLAMGMDMGMGSSKCLHRQTGALWHVRMCHGIHKP